MFCLYFLGTYKLSQAPAVVLAMLIPIVQAGSVLLDWCAFCHKILESLVALWCTCD
jgi:hypothetical protein